MVGGGTGTMRPGEISLATGGVLFLDELGEFHPSALDAMRQPLEEGVVRVSRAHSSVTFPARFLLVGAMNPCPCGFGGGPGFCRCSDSARARYHRRVSGPLLDRFDLRIDVQRPAADELLRGSPGEDTATVAARVAAVRARAAARGVAANAALSGKQLQRHAPLEDEASALLEGALRDGRISARGLTRLHTVARTVADLDEISGAPPGPVRRKHVALALSLRASLPVLEGWAHAG
jgi:magnesium chelatase family protein